MFIEAGYSDFRAEVGNNVTDSVAIATASSGGLYPGDSFGSSLQHVLHYTNILTSKEDTT